MSDRGDLWALVHPGGGERRTFVLHATEKCCGARPAKRQRVRDFANPGYFNSVAFEPCPVAQASGWGRPSSDGGR